MTIGPGKLHKRPRLLSEAMFEILYIVDRRFKRLVLHELENNGSKNLKLRTKPYYYKRQRCIYLYIFAILIIFRQDGCCLLF